jgi:hypothetical protein
LMPLQRAPAKGDLKWDSHRWGERPREPSSIMQS